jgi:hypothetical protein
MTIYKVGDVVIRDGGVWRGVSPGDVHKVSEVHGGNICLVGFDGITFDGDNFSLYHRAKSSTTAEVEVGDIVRMTSRTPRYGAGCIDVGDEGVVISLDGDGEYHVKFPKHARWHSGEDDCELVNKTVVPKVSLDEAVNLCKDARTEIKELEDKVKALKDSIKAYEQVIRDAGLTFI